MPFTQADLPKGITFRSTPSHGYWDLSAAKLAEMPEALQRQTPFYSGNGVFEEDQEYNRVVAAFPEAFPADWVDNAHKVLKDSLPDIYEEWTGEVIPLEESREKRQRAFAEQHKNDWVVTSASLACSWNNVPEGIVGVVAVLGGRGDSLNYVNKAERQFLVEIERYRSREEGVSYVIDLERDQEFTWSE